MTISRKNSLSLIEQTLSNITLLDLHTAPNLCNPGHILSKTLDLNLESTAQLSNCSIASLATPISISGGVAKRNSKRSICKSYEATESDQLPPSIPIKSSGVTKRNSKRSISKSYEAADPDLQYQSSPSTSTSPPSSSLSRRKHSLKFTCEICEKTYKHPNCLAKHMWEHSSAWAQTHKLTLSKHATVQLLEAAKVLVGLGLDIDHLDLTLFSEGYEADANDLGEEVWTEEMEKDDLDLFAMEV